MSARFVRVQPKGFLKLTSETAAKLYNQMCKYYLIRCHKAVFMEVSAKPYRDHLNDLHS